MTDRKSQLDVVAVASLVPCCALWGVNQVAAKVALAAVTVCIAVVSRPARRPAAA